MSILLYSLLTIVAYGVVTAVYVVVQAIVGRAVGATVEGISVGFGPKVLSFNRNSTDYTFRLLPIGGSTKFVGEPEDEDDLIQQNRPLSFDELPVISRMLVVLSGPLSNLVIGLSLFYAATQFPNSLLIVEENAGNQINPSGVPNLAIEASAATISSQLEFFKLAVCTFFNKLVTFQSLEGWGGLLGFLTTCGAVATHSFGGWLSCLAILCLGTFLVNMIPIIPMNGGALVLLVCEPVLGKPSQKLLVGSMLLYFPIAIAACVRLLIADLHWFFPS